MDMDDDESDGAEANDDPLARTNVRAGLSTLICAVVSIPWRSLIEL